MIIVGAGLIRRRGRSMRTNGRHCEAPSWVLIVAFLVLACVARAAAPEEIDADGYLYDYEAVHCKAIDGIYDDTGLMTVEKQSDGSYLAVINLGIDA